MEPRYVPEISRRSIAAAEALIRPYIRRTPVLELGGAELGLDSRVRIVLKLEFLQHAGSFKTRGAFVNLLMRQVPVAGVVAASGGNHGAAVAYASMRRDVPATIFVPSISSPAKIARIRAYGAQLVVGGDRYADALAASEAMAAESGALPIHAFDQAETLLGQGTVAFELAQQAPQIETVLVAVGGGGLIGGIAAWYGDRGDAFDAVAVHGVEPETAPTLSAALAAGEPVDAAAGGIAADSLAPRRIGATVFPILKHHVSGVALVTDDAIRAAQRALWETARIVAEPGGAAALAALLSGRYVPRSGERIAVIVSGANTTAVDFER